eukprot:7861064-Pyramimonas_sp.AAC.1
MGGAPGRPFPTLALSTELGRSRPLLPPGSPKARRPAGRGSRGGGASGRRESGREGSGGRGGDLDT